MSKHHHLNPQEKLIRDETILRIAVLGESISTVGKALFNMGEAISSVATVLALEQVQKRKYKTYHDKITELEKTVQHLSKELEQIKIAQRKS